MHSPVRHGPGRAWRAGTRCSASRPRFHLTEPRQAQLRAPAAGGLAPGPPVFPDAGEQRPGGSGGSVQRTARTLQPAHSGYWAGAVVWLRFPGVVQVRVPGVGVARVQPGVCLHWWSCLHAGLWVHLQAGSGPERAVVTGGHPGGRRRAAAAEALRREDTDRARMSTWHRQIR
jgi:hypothetical protein